MITFLSLFTETRSLNSSQSSPIQRILLATLLERSCLSLSQLELQASHQAHLTTSSFYGNPFHWFLYSDKTYASMENSYSEDETLGYVSDSSFLSMDIVTLVIPTIIPVRSFYSSLKCSSHLPFHLTSGKYLHVKYLAGADISLSIFILQFW